MPKEPDAVAPALVTLAGINPDELSPKEALEVIYQLKRLATARAVRMIRFSGAGPAIWITTRPRLEVCLLIRARLLMVFRDFDGSVEDMFSGTTRRAW